MKDGDQLIQFGSLHAGSFTDIKELSVIVQNSINVSASFPSILVTRCAFPILVALLLHSETVLNTIFLTELTISSLLKLELLDFGVYVVIIITKYLAFFRE